jgi:hypothetical protein
LLRVGQVIQTALAVGFLRLTHNESNFSLFAKSVSRISFFLRV